MPIAETSNERESPIPEPQAGKSYRSTKLTSKINFWKQFDLTKL
jgi:hypothetical protein